MKATKHDSFRAVLFDFDGVLVNSEPLHFMAFKTAADSLGIGLSEAEYYDELLGYDDRGAWKKLLVSREIEASSAILLELLAFKSRVMRELIQSGKFAATPGASELVRTLWRHYPLAICSGAAREEIEGMLENIGLRDCFRVITAAEDVAIGKPDPSGYMQTAAELSRLSGKIILPSHCLIVEDSPRVVKSVKKVGFRVLGVAGSVAADALTTAGADAVVSDLSPASVKKAMPNLVR